MIFYFLGKLWLYYYALNSKKYLELLIFILNVLEIEVLFDYQTYTSI